MIDKAPRKPGDDPRPRLDLPQQQTSGLRSDRLSVKPIDHFATPQPLKHRRIDLQLMRLDLTLCLHGTASLQV